MTPKVTVCIPAYQAEAFIDRTLTCARGQTYPHLRILVSVDQSVDKTADICRYHAREDCRVEVMINRESLGWSQNANATLDRVDTEFFFLYFHDDIIEPVYVETLLWALQNDPNAATAHCDLVEFGLIDQVRPAHAYTGSALARLVEFMASPEKGTTLRSLTRTNRVSNSLRFPQIPGENAWSAYPFHFRQLAAGPGIAVHNTLYKRWQRQGSLTGAEGWLPRDITAMLESQRESAGVCLNIIDQAAETQAERQAGQYCLCLFMLLYTRNMELRLGTNHLTSAHDISPIFSENSLSSDIDCLALHQQKWIRQMKTEIMVLEQKIKLGVGNIEEISTPFTKSSPQIGS